MDIDINSAWENFIKAGDLSIPSKTNKQQDINNENIPKGTDIYISTQTKIAYLSHMIDLFNVFWKIPIIDYYLPKDGIIKKQMKFNFTNEESIDLVEEKLLKEKNVDQYIITQIVNPCGRIKFKDIRKISIGLSSKDITSYRSKKKSAFYNCFVLILRIKEQDYFKEIHIKVFNTGKLEIPGIRSDLLLIKVMDYLVFLLKPLTGIKDLDYDIKNFETVLINSNFNCGFYINREILLDILKYKYKLNCIFDSCQYPGIQCKYNYENVESGLKYKISFMIFRTGSVLIVGKCNEDILQIVYEYIKDLLIKEYNNISIKNLEFSKDINKKKKIKKKVIYLEKTY